MSDSVTPWTAARQASLSFTVSWSLLKLMSLSQWCHPTISSFVTPFSCLQSYPASGFIPMSQFFSSGGQSIGVSVSASVLPMNIQSWFLLGLTGLISLQSKGTVKSLLKHHSSKASISQHLAFFIFQFSHSYSDYWKNHSIDYKIK